jgi:RIH domain
VMALLTSAAPPHVGGAVSPAARRALEASLPARTAVMRAAHRFLCAFAHSNPTNQGFVASALPIAAAQLPLGVGAERTLVTLLRGNRRLVETCGETIATACVDMVGRRGLHDATWLLPLHELTHCDGAPMKANQSMVLKALLEAPGAVCLCADGLPAAVAGRPALLAELAAAPRGKALSGVPAYHVGILRLLCAACEGHNGSAEAKCQAVLPLTE